MLRKLVILLSLLSLLACEKAVDSPVDNAAVKDPATSLYINGNILTMDDARPSAEALAIRDGKILAVGTRTDVETVAGNNIQVNDLKGKTLLPGFIDSHGHISAVISFMAFANVASPPVGNVNNIADIQALLSKKVAGTPAGEWIMGAGYDDSLLDEKRHPTKFDLDAVSTQHPIMLWHVSAHLMACNSLCLEIAGISAETEDPEDAVIRRVEGSREPNGVLEESLIWEIYNKHLPIHDTETRLKLLGEAQDYYAKYGLTTVQDGASMPSDLQALSKAAQQGSLKLDIVAFPWHLFAGVMDEEFPYSRQYQNRFRVGGLKLSLDGSPQGKTAWLTESYHEPPDGREAEYKGYPAMTDGDVYEHIVNMYRKEIPVIAHANGDAAMDQLITSVKKANEAEGRADRRTVIIHAQTAREDQIDQFKQQGMLPSYFVAHTFFWGDWHRDSVLGPERGKRISPLASTIDRGVPHTIHNDTPVVPPDMMRLVWTAVNRVTRSGQTLGEEQKISVEDALKAITIGGAYQYFEEDSKGSLEAGKLADLVILAENPLKVEPLTIKDIKVVETIKEGKSIYRSDGT